MRISDVAFHANRLSSALQESPTPDPVMGSQVSPTPSATEMQLISAWVEQTLSLVSLCVKLVN
jgi:hypothetical protein